MFYSLYRNVNVAAGGLWFDPKDGAVIQVTDMASAAGEEGITLIEDGSLYITQERLEKAAKSADLFQDQPPPEPPTGRKHWDPRPWAPPTKPGYLFWMPVQPVPGPKVLEAWDKWSELLQKGITFEELLKSEQHYILIGAEALESYYGFDVNQSMVVIEYGPGMQAKKDQWGDSSVISKNPERAVWKILKEWGVRDDG